MRLPNPALTLPMQEYNVKPVKTVTNGAARPATLPNSNHNSGYSTEQADRSVYSLYSGPPQLVV